MVSQIGLGFTNRLRSNLGLLAVLGVLLVIYLPTLQTIVNGSEHQLMVDAGEIQIVLNSWGTLHATGYPLYTMLGSLMVAAMTALGVGPAAAVSIVSLVWGLAALAVVYVLAFDLTRKNLLALGLVFCLGLMRVVWIHLVSPEVLSFAFLLEAVLFWLALTPRPIPHRLAWLTLVGSFGVAHHRTLVFLVPALIYAVVPTLRELWRVRSRELLWLPLLAIVGALPYIYLPLRAYAGAEWVYGEPGTWNGFLDQVLGREGFLIFTLPSPNLVESNLTAYSAYLGRELNWIVILLGLAGLVWGASSSRFRRPAITFLILIVAVCAFLVLFTMDIELPDAFVTLVFAMAIGIGLGILFLFELSLATRLARPLPQIAFTGFVLIYAASLLAENFNEVFDLTHDATGLKTIALAEQAPPGATFFLPWGTRYFAVGFAQSVLGQLSHIRRADDKVSAAQLAATGTLVTPDYTLFARSVEEWQAQLGTRVYPRAIAPHLVQLDTRPQVAGAELFGQTAPSGSPVAAVSEAIECTHDAINLNVEWAAMDKPPRDFAIFVHLMNAGGQVLAQADQAAPVYGWHPLSHWEKGEIVSDIYPLPRMVGADNVKYGLYRVAEDGTFQNALVRTVEIDCL